MAYANIYKVACADKQEWFARFRDFICKRNGTYDYSTTGIGWTIHDSSYAVDEDNMQIYDWIVFKSTGEDGKEDLYIRMTWGDGDFDCHGFLYWNNSTHAGVFQYNTIGQTMKMAESGTNTPDLCVWGDLDFLFFGESAMDTNYDYYGCFGKMANSILDNTIAISSAGASSGAGASIVVDAVPSSWVVGSKIFIRDTVRVDEITILSISGTTITADLSYSYSAGCKLQASIGYAVNGNANNIAMYVLCRQAGVASSTTHITIGVNTSSNTPTVLNPNSATGEYWGEEIRIGYSNYGYGGRIPNVYWGATAPTVGTVVTDADGVSYRKIRWYSSINLFVKEV